jgi:hypothetical protein
MWLRSMTALEPYGSSRELRITQFGRQRAGVVRPWSAGEQLAFLLVELLVGEHALVV